MSRVLPLGDVNMVPSIRANKLKHWLQKCFYFSLEISPQEIFFWNHSYPPQTPPPPQKSNGQLLEHEQCVNIAAVQFGC